MNELVTPRFMPTHEVQLIAGGISRTTLWRWVRDGHFPKPRKIGPNRIGWLENEVTVWSESRDEAA